MRSWLARSPITGFFVLAFGIAWIGWVPTAIYSWVNPSFRMANPVLALMLFAFGPTFAGLIMAGVTEGKPAVRTLLRRAVAWRVGLGWYLFVVLIPLVMLLVGAWLRAAMGGAPVDFAGSQGRLMAPGISPWLLLPVFMIVGLPAGPLAEELGWRGFALPRLQARFGPFWASLILGVVWGAWHLPLFYVPNTSQFGTSFVPFLVSVVINTFFFTWVHNRCGGSLLMAILLHAAFNSMPAVIPARPTEWPVIGVGAIVALAVILWSRTSWFGRAPVRKAA